MGLEAVELILNVEESFDIAITDKEASQLQNAGDLVTLVEAKLSVKRTSTCLSAVAFYRLRKTLMQRFGTQRRSIRPGRIFAEIVPAQNRRKNWKLLGDAIGLQLRDLGRSAGVCGLVIIAASAVGGFTVALLDGDGYISGWELLAGFISVLIAACLGMRLTRFRAVCLPPEYATVGDAAKILLRDNYGVIARETGGCSQNEIWAVLKQQIADITGTDPSSIRPDSSFRDILND